MPAVRSPAVRVLALLGALAGALLALSGSSSATGDGAHSCPSGSGSWRVGAAKADITPTQWPVAEAAYGFNRRAVGAAHPFYARAIVIQSCSNGQTIVLTAVDSQGYFPAYKDDPVSLAATDGYGTSAIRQTVARDTGLAVANILVSSTHTHNSPDSVGVWGGGTVANNKGPYLSRVKTQTVSAIEASLRALRPAALRVGTADVSALASTLPQVARDPTAYPVDHTMRVLQANDARDCSPIATLVNVSIHATAAGQINGPGGDQAKGLIDPDWPGRVASDLERDLPGDGAVVMSGAVGRTQPAFPVGTDPHGDPVTEAGAYGDVMNRRVETAVSDSRPVDQGPVGVADATLNEELAEPALVPLFAAEQGISNPIGGQLVIGGVMRSNLPPYAVGTVLRGEVQTFRLGSLLMAGAPGEAYPEVQTELAKRVQSASSPFVFSLAGDQLGYTPPAFEYPVVALQDGSDEGIFTINAHFGDDLINQHLAAARTLGFVAQTGYDGTTAGPVQPPDQNSPHTLAAASEPPEKALSISCPASAAAPLPGAASAIPSVVHVGMASTGRCFSRRHFPIHIARRRHERLLGAVAYVNGRRVRVHLGRRLRAVVDLRGLPPGRFQVKLVLRLRSRGRTVVLHRTRTYHTCALRRRARHHHRRHHRAQV